MPDPVTPASPGQPDYSRPDPALLTGDTCPACGQRHACPTCGSTPVLELSGLGRHPFNVLIPCPSCGADHFRVLTRLSPVGPIILGATFRARVVMRCPLWEPRPPSQVRGAGTPPQQTVEGQAPAPPPPPCAGSGLTFFPGAFVYRGHRQPLCGKPLEVLRALAEAHGQTCTACGLLKAIWPETIVTEDTVRSAVSGARQALREAMRVAGVEGPVNPIPVVDRGTGRLAWRLDLP
jgi:hypothetical protein